MAKPRRKVVSAKGSGPSWQNMFTCTLSCGHKARVIGRWEDARKKAATPPATATCRECPDKSAIANKAPATLATVKPPRNRRTRLREDV